MSRTALVRHVIGGRGQAEYTTKGGRRASLGSQANQGLSFSSIGVLE